MDRSLDEFTTADAGADATDADEPSTDDTRGPTEDSVNGTTDADGIADETATEDDATPDGGATEDGTGGPSLTVRPATSTMDWTPGGATCASCGATVERRWRDDGRLVCLDCKQW
jgi:hypothetical protein